MSFLPYRACPADGPHRFRRRISRLHAAALASLLFAAGCQAAPPPEPAPEGPEYRPTATVRDLMRSIVDESADVVWLAVTATHTAKGIEEVRPQNDEEWEQVRYGALALAESANLLLMPGRPVARPGERSATPGVELEPTEIEALIAEDRAAWNTRALALHDAAASALTAIEAQDADALFALGEDIELACEGCHSTFWYPNEVLPEFPDTPTEP